jgi:hypothetical protein
MATKRSPGPNDTKINIGAHIERHQHNLFTQAATKRGLGQADYVRAVVFDAVAADLGIPRTELDDAAQSFEAAAAKAGLSPTEALRLMTQALGGAAASKGLATLGGAQAQGAPRTNPPQVKRRKKVR